MSLSQDIESRIQIIDVVQRYVSLKKAGLNYKGLCPFHQERTPSFIVSPQKNIAHCFSCGKWGGPIRFLMEVEKIDFREAVQMLAKEAGVELKTDYAKERQERWGDIYALYRKTAEWYHQSFFAPENKKYLDYLLDRQISLDTIKKFQLWCSTQPRDLWYYLKEVGFTPEFLIESGIFVSEGRDKFFGRITYPIANSMWHVVAFTARVLDASLPKYLNSPASNIFDKSSTLYGLHLAKQSIAKSGECFIVEGQMDTIALHQAGIDRAVGISGTALTAEHIRLLKRFAQVIYLTLDRDDAGIKATFSSLENLLNSDIEVRIIAIPNGKDPDEFLKSWGDFEALKQIALSPVGFLLAEGRRQYDLSTVIGKKKLVEKCIEYLLQIRSDLEIDMRITEISRELGISTEAIRSEYKKAKNTPRSTRSSTLSTFSDMPSETPSQKRVFHFSEILAGYIFEYSLFDLFSQEFRYNLSDLSSERDFSLLYRVVSREALDDESIELLKTITLSLEQHSSPESTSTTEKAVRDLIRVLHARLLIIERDVLLASSGSDLLRVQKVLVDKAISLGLPPSVLR